MIINTCSKTHQIEEIYATTASIMVYIVGLNHFTMKNNVNDMVGA